jgi:enolase
LSVTNSKYLKRGIEEKSANAILIKINQIGTLTETFDAIEMAKTASFKSIVSYRSGEMEDPKRSNLAVVTNVGQTKTNSRSRTKRICKCNQSLCLEEYLKSNAIHAGQIMPFTQN